jgi:hypothetical protein
MTEENSIVSELNTWFWEQTGIDDWTPFSLSSNGADFAIEFLGNYVYNSGCDFIDDDEGWTFESKIKVICNELIDTIKGLEEIK